jgi:hypothetical protein
MQPLPDLYLHLKQEFSQTGGSLIIHIKSYAVCPNRHSQSLSADHRDGDYIYRLVQSSKVLHEEGDRTQPEKC